jgi:hypothetical protein
MRFATTEERDTTMQYGVEEGAKGGFARIDKLLARLGLGPDRYPQAIEEGSRVVVEYIRYTIDDARAQAFEQAYTRSGEALKESQHCEQYEVSPARRIRPSTWFVSSGSPRRAHDRLSTESRVPQLLRGGRPLRPRHRGDASLPSHRLERRMRTPRETRRTRGGRRKPFKGDDMLQGSATINYWTDDMEAAKRWYSELLGVEPYFERAGPEGRLAYAEFRIGDYEDELGLVDCAWAPAGAATEPGGAIM